VVYRGRPALVYDECDAPSLLRSLADKPWTLWKSARMFARLHEDIHTRYAENMQSQYTRLERSIRKAIGLNDVQKTELVHRLQQLPTGDRLCHGDFHPDNVLMGREGPIIVDWADATQGNPWADVAQTALLFQVSRLPVGTPRPWLLAIGRSWFHWLYVRFYMQNRAADCWQLAAWMPIVAAARLTDGPEEEHDALMALIRRYMIKD
jgi:aminoglycoside phosphotransferase (APT) family kinase protein